MAGLKCAVDMKIQQNLNIKWSWNFIFIDQLIWSKILDWMLGKQRCDKCNRYAMPLERSIEVCISLIIGLDSLF